MAINRDKVYDGAMKLLAQSKFDKAIAEFDKLVIDDPKDVRTLLKIAETLHVKMGKRREALERYDRAATIYAEQGFFLKAVAVFKQMLTVDATNPDLILRLAELYQQLGYGSQSVMHYQQVVVLFEQQGRGRDALAILKRMVDLDPENLQSRVKVAELFAQQGMLAEASAELRAAWQFLRDQQRVDDAMRVGERLVQWDPGALDVAFDLATSYMSRGDPRSALARLELCFKADPRNVDVLALIAQAFLATEQTNKAVSVVRELARIHDASGDTAAARAHWEKVLELAPGDEPAETALGRRTVAPAAPRVAPDEEQLQRLLTETDVYVKYGLRDKAVEHLEKVFALRPDHIPGLEKLKQLQTQMKQPAAAAATLERLIRRGEETGHPKVAEWRAEAQRGKPAGPTPAAPRVEPAPARAPESAFIDDDGPTRIAPSALAPASPASTIAPAVSTSQPLRSAAMLRGGAPRLLPPDDVLTDGPDPATGPGTSPSSQREAATRLVALVDDSVGGGAGTAADAQTLPPDEPLIAAGEGDDASSHAMPPLPAGDGGSVEGAPADEYVLETADIEVRSTPTAPPPPAFDESELDALAAQAVREALPARVTRADEAATSIIAFTDEDVGELQAFVHRSIEGAATSQTGLVATTDAAPPLAARADAALPPEFTTDDEPDFDSERTIAYDARAAMAAITAATAKPPAGPSPATVPASPDTTSPPTDFGDGFGAGGDPVDATAEFSPAGDARVQPPIAPPERPEEAFGDSPFADPGYDTGADAVQGAAQGAYAGGALDPLVTGSFPVEPSASMLSFASVDASAIEEIAPPPPPVMSLAPVASVDDVPDQPSQARALFQPDRGFEDDPANTFFADELAEAEFFLQQDLLDEARDVLTPILDEMPESARVRHMLARVAARENGEPEPAPPWEQQLLDDVAEQLNELAALAPRREIPSHPDQVSVEEVLSQFKRGVAEIVPDDDAATHYDLGIAYREMGLLDDAVGEFEIAARAPVRAADALFLIGLVRGDQARHDDALAALERALATPSATREQRAAAEYQRGVIFEEHRAMTRDALASFRRSRELGGNAPDLQRRIDALASALGDVEAPSLQGATRGGRGKNIDYV